MAATRRAEYRRVLERLRAARLAAGLTQVQAARRLGKPQSYVSKCESGERRMDFIELEEFARLYGKPLGHFASKPTRSGATKNRSRRS